MSRTFRLIGGSHHGEVITILHGNSVQMIKRIPMPERFFKSGDDPLENKAIDIETYVICESDAVSPNVAGKILVLHGMSDKDLLAHTRSDGE